MRHALLSAAALGVLVFLNGCVELTGQRIAWSYDPGSDTLKALIFYDGIHDTGQQSDGTEQIAEFVAEGNVMIVDWFAHYPIGKLRGATDDPNADEDARKLGEALKQVSVQSIGHYREPDGRIGAAQLVTFKNAKAVVSQINAALNRMITRDLDQNGDADPNWSRSQKLIRDAAAAGHSWVSLDGHAIRVTVPIDNREWAKQKATILTELFAIGGDERDADAKQGVVILRQLISASAVSYAERAGAIDITIGRTDETSVLRFDIRDAYEDNLAGAVIKHVPKYIDKELNDWLLGPAKGPAPVGGEEVLDFGPPEVRALSLMNMTRRVAPDEREKGFRWLRGFAEKWNESKGLPSAPEPNDDHAAYIQAWTRWYNAMKHWPVNDN